MRFLPLAVAVALSGCTLATSKYSVAREDAANKEAALVYGYFDMGDAPSLVQRMQVKRVLPRSDKPYLYFGVDSELFYHEALTPGSYQISSLTGVPALLHLGVFHVFPGNIHFYSMPAQGGGFRVAGSGLHYWGSYKFKRGGTFFKPTFEFEPAKKPTELDVLKKLAGRVQGTKWEKPVAKRMQELAAR
jgi:hypothetical protein